MRNNRTLIARSVGVILFVFASSAWSLGDQWYVGLGGGVSILEPNPDETGLNVDKSQGTTGSFILGRDIDDRASVQLQVYSLGESELTDGQTIPYTAADASVLYRLYDTRDSQLRRGTLGTALYGRFGLGFADRDTNVLLENNQDIYFGLGGGAEFFLTPNIAIRAEAFYHDQDALSAQIALVTRFGGTRRLTPRAPQVPVPEVPGPKLPAPELPKVGVQEEPAPVVAPEVITPVLPVPVPTPQVADQPIVPTEPNENDRDGDGVIDSADACENSPVGYPVLENGCPLFEGVLSGIQFVDLTSDLAPNATVQLDYLANLLKRYPDARVELHAHTDSRGDAKSQSVITRGRLRTVGTYLVEQGIRANRLVLRSFGGSRPIYDNATTQGLLGNNRFEVIEHLTSQ